MPLAEPPPSADSPPRNAPPLGWVARLALVPGLVVLAIVLVALVAGWLAVPSGDADSLVAALEQEGAGRWQAAVDLALLLCGPDSQRLKADPLLARRLSGVLERDLRTGGLSSEHVRLRVYLCRSLGEFQAIDALPALVEAAAVRRDEREADVQRSAIEGIAVLAGNLGPRRVRDQAGLVSTLARAASDPNPNLRSAAAFALGVVGGPEAETHLERLLVDAQPEVRYNAATGLARQGNARATDVLVEMLAPKGPSRETAETDRGASPTQVQLNALRAARQLATANPEFDLAALTAAVMGLIESDAGPTVRALAAEVLSDLVRAEGGGSSSGYDAP